MAPAAISTGDLSLWITDDEPPPTPPPKTPRSMGFSKTSMASIASSSTASTSRRPTAPSAYQSRTSESTTDDIPSVSVSYSPDLIIPGTTSYTGSLSSSSNTYLASEVNGGNGNGRERTNSSGNGNMLRKMGSKVGNLVKRSKSKARMSDEYNASAAPVPPLPDLPTSTATSSSLQASTSQASVMSTSSLIPFKNNRKRSRDPTSNNSAGSIPEDSLGGTKFDFDLDLGSMDGIVDPLRLGLGSRMSLGDEREKDEGGLNEISIMQVDHHAGGANGNGGGGGHGGVPSFSDPWPHHPTTSHQSNAFSSPQSKRRRHAAEKEKERERGTTASSSNTTRLHTGSSGRLTTSSSHHGEPPSTQHQPALVPDALLAEPQNAMGWKAPDSWVTDKDGHIEPESGGSEDEFVVGSSLHSNSNGNGNGSVLGSPHESVGGNAGRSGRRPGSAGGERGKRKSKPVGMAYKLKVHIGSSSNDFRVLSLGLATPTHSVCRFLAKELLGRPDDSYRLYLKERGRERILGNSERPADIVRRRLEQAGYTPADGLEVLGGESLSFLLKFVYKSNVLGTTEDDTKTLSSYTHVDLTNKGLRTIPIALYARAHEIETLDLSRNPMLEIPRDFIKDCTNLRALVLSNMAIKRVPASARLLEPLYTLDVSCNRIADLNDAGLDHLKSLTRLYAQNNRMENLPWYFPRLKALTRLNISNNKFRGLPSVVCELTGLTHLDVSFNMLEDLPSDICALVKLEELIMVGNRVTAFPTAIYQLTSLRILDCRRNLITDIGPVSMLPALERLSVNHNALQSVSLTSGRFMREIDLGFNDITSISLLQGPIGSPPTSLTTLDLSHAKLSSLDGLDFGWMPGLQIVRVDGNGFRALPESISSLAQLRELSAADNSLEDLPVGIGMLQNLEVLDVRSNCLQEVPAEIWRCGRLRRINMTSNVIAVWNPPAPPEDDERKASLAPSVASTITSISAPTFVAPTVNGGSTSLEEKAPEASDRPVPPLVHSLTSLFLGENGLHDQALAPLMLLRNLRVLNLSFNEIQGLPANLFTALHRLTHLYVSGNRLASLPTEGLGSSATKAARNAMGQPLVRGMDVSGGQGVQLRVLFLNGNRLQTLPQELGKVTTLESLDVGSNELRYNINNWEFDWNWNFNQNLRYLNLSGNKRLEIKPDASRKSQTPTQLELAGFSNLPHLRVLGLMDVTTTFTNHIPDDAEERRVRTSLSAFGAFVYGIADNLGAASFGLPDPFSSTLREASSARSLSSKYKRDALPMVPLRADPSSSRIDPSSSRLPSAADMQRYDPQRTPPAPELDPADEISVRMFDLVIPRFRDRPDEALFAMFGRARAPPANAKIAKFLHDHLAHELATQLSQVHTARGEGPPDALRRAFLRLNWLAHDHLFASGRKNSTQSGYGYGNAPINAKDAQALGASGVVVYVAGRMLYVANAGAALAVVSRRGHAEPVSTKHDPFIRAETDRIRQAEGWVSPKGLVNDDAPVSRSFGYYHLVPVVNARPDVAPYELTDLDEFVIIANEGLWDFISPQTAVDIARTERADPGLAAQKLRDLAISYGAEGTAMIMVVAVDRNTQKKRDPENALTFQPKTRALDPRTGRLPSEPAAPTGHLALVFTDIRNSTVLWDTNAGMPTAIRMHHSLLRRELRVCEGYEVKTEGDAFMVAFKHVGAALLWCLTVQARLLEEQWPREILDSSEGRERHGPTGELLARGLSVRMGIHCGSPVCEKDVTTQRMDYYGPMVNRAARVMGNAAGGQIMLTADVVRELQEGGWERNDEVAVFDPQFVLVGEVKLKGLEMPEILSLVYPHKLLGRQDLVLEELEAPPPNPEESADATTAAAQADDANQYPEACTAENIRELASLVVRMKALASGRVFRPAPPRKSSTHSASALLDVPAPTASFLSFASSSTSTGSSTPSPSITLDPALLIPPYPERISDADLEPLLETMLNDLEQAVQAIQSRFYLPQLQVLLDVLQAGKIGGSQIDALLASFGNDAGCGRPP
ncbi:L domain-like protein [Peniophora sp. CONT]|nr:L domain-like protein [Peniophora sp. CONT]